MDKLIQKIHQKIAVDYCRLSIVCNPDGLLCNEDVKKSLSRLFGIDVVCGSQLQLRIHFELVYKQSNKSKHFVYVTTDAASILPDMAKEAFVCQFSTTDLFPLFTDKSLLNRQSVEVLAELNRQMPVRRLSIQDCRSLIEKICRQLKEQHLKSVSHYQKRLQSISIDWGKRAETMSAVSDIICQVVKAGLYEELTDEFSYINESFQKWLDNHYFAIQNNSHIIHPYCVNKILPYLAEKHVYENKVALVVVDGFALWQWTILRDSLHDRGVMTDDNVTMAWIPTITMLSRQAIFRGSYPVHNYHQSPASEKRLWQDFWLRHGCTNSQIQYLSDSDDFVINEATIRLAYVTTEMDEKMHACNDLKDLHSLTENWCPRICEKLTMIKNMGFTIYLTSDHGSTQAYGKRQLTSVEKVFLYKDGSRGKRHLIYNHLVEMEKMYNSLSADMSVLKHDDWLALRDSSALCRNGEQLVTHGGCNMTEVVVPFIKI